MSHQHHFPVAAIGEHGGDFERVLWTGLNAQLVLLTLQPGESQGEEIREHADKLVVVVSGAAEITLESGPIGPRPGDVVVVPRGTRHEVRNTGSEPLVFHAIYAPPQHAVYGEYATREDAEAAEESGEDFPPKHSN